MAISAQRNAHICKELQCAHGVCEYVCVYVCVCCKFDAMLCCNSGVCDVTRARVAGCEKASK